jgi:hypothetical protein
MNKLKGEQKKEEEEEENNNNQRRRECLGFRILRFVEKNKAHW